MVQAMIKISDRTNRILKTIKAKYNFKNKSETIDFLARWYGEKILKLKLWYTKK